MHIRLNKRHKFAEGFPKYEFLNLLSINKYQLAQKRAALTTLVNKTAV